MSKSILLEPYGIVSTLLVAVGLCLFIYPAAAQEAAWDELRAKIDNGKFEEAKSDLARFVAENPEHPRLSDAGYYLAYLEEDPDKRKKALERFVAEYPRHHLAPTALAELARYHQIIGNTEDAAREWSKLLMNYRNDPQAGEALYWLGIIALERRDFRVARDNYFSNLIRDFKDHPKVPWADIAIGDSHFLEGEYEEAAIAFLQALSRYPEPDLAADLHLRLGQSYERMGDLKRAMAEYELVVKQFAASLDAPIARQRLRNLESRNRETAINNVTDDSITDSTITVESSDPSVADTLLVIERYGLQLGSFSRYGNALDLSRKLQTKGYEVEVRRVNRDGRIHHQVILGSYPSLEEARQAGQVFTAREGLPYFITSY